MFRLRKPAKTIKPKIPAGASRQIFHSVSVVADPIDCCPAAQLITKQRYLADDAPMLPLAACTNPQGCRCKYEHYDDRRTDSRRESDLGMPPKYYAEKEVRSGFGRRVTDG